MLKFQTLTRGKERTARKSILPEATDNCDLSQSSVASCSSTSSSENSTANRRSRSILSLLRTNRSTSVSSLSSSSSNRSSCEASLEWATVRVYTHNIRKDCDYKTLFISSATTAEELVASILAKFEVKIRDPNLCFIAMEIKTFHEGVATESNLILERRAKPLELLNCHPQGNARFVLHMRKGSLLKIYDSSLTPQSNYKSLLISQQTTAAEVIEMFLNSYDIPVPGDNFILSATDPHNFLERVLLPIECPLRIEQADWWEPHYQLHIRHVPKARNILRIPVNHSGKSQHGTIRSYRFASDSSISSFFDDFDPVSPVNLNVS